MNWYQLSLFSENLGQMIEKGVPLRKAIDVACGVMVRRKNRQFVKAFGACLLEGQNLQKGLSSYPVPSFYLAMLNCGQITGRLPEALKRTASYIQQLMPLKMRIWRCLSFSLLAYAFSIVIKSLFWSADHLTLLLALGGVVFLPMFIKPLKFVRDAILAKLPFTGTWIEQLSLMEFFLCLDLSYDTDLTINEMFTHSIRAIGNRYHQKMMKRSHEWIEQRSSIADSLGKVAFIPRGIIQELEVAETSGTLDRTFSRLSGELQKLVQAKLEPVKALATAIIINLGFLFPLVVILPLFVSNNSIIILMLTAMMAYVPLMCLRYAVTAYLDKSADVNLSWKK